MTSLLQGTVNHYIHVTYTAWNAEAGGARQTGYHSEVSGRNEQQCRETKLRLHITNIALGIHCHCRASNRTRWYRVAASDATQPSIADRSARLGARWRFLSEVLVEGSVRCEVSQRMIASRSYVTLCV